MRTIPSEVFKAYDVRGIQGRDLDADAAEQIGRAFVRVLAAQTGKPASELALGLGRDMRLTAPEMAAAYSAGMQAEGAHVLDAGMVGTEMLYFLVGSRDLDGGAMCTASHNPKAYTGVKLVGRGALPLSGETGIGDIRDLIAAGQLGDDPTPSPPGSVEQLDISEAFQEAAMRFIDPSQVKPLKVVVDGGNGMAGPMVGPLLERLGLDLAEAYWTPDGNFPDHEPNPLLPENREFIMAEVVRRGADLGIAWDGDADRCFFIDGGTPLINRVGHAFFKQRMREDGGIFGGEVSGHYYFHDFYCADSGTLPALLLLELVSQRGATLSELVNRYRSKYFISGEINSEVSDPAAKIEELADHYADARQSRLDGISIDYDDWHFNVRSSNTEPLLRLCLESLVSHEDMEAKRDEVLGLIRA